MKIATIIARVLLGLVFVVFGSNAFLKFLGSPPELPGLAGDYMRAFMGSGYVYAVAVVQILGGVLLLVGRFVPLGLTLLAPIVVNILLFHFLLMPEGWQPGAVVAALELFLVWRYRDAFRGIVRP
jgi:putative oxidoreductase